MLTNTVVAGLTLAGLLVAAPIQAQVNAVADSGTADQGIGSQPVKSVVQNDTINGAAVVLGTGGNGVIAKLGTWQTGVTLNTSTGAVTAGVNVPIGTYNGQYQLCDLSTPANCATTTVSVSVVSAAVVANPVTGSAKAGVGSRPIPNVAASDTVNGGVQASVGTNATVAQSGTWPAAIVLNPANGSINTSASLGVGQYQVTYRLCDKNVPAQCATSTATIAVSSTPPVVANAVSGASQAGLVSTPIANVVASDTVNFGTPATLGSGGNSTVSQVGTWPTGISLNTATGAVNVAASVKPGTYVMTYQLCDLNAPANCASANASAKINAVIVATADAGTSYTSNTGTVIASVVANDTVNNAAAVLGASGNATIASVGSWPAGLSFNTSTGAVSITSVLPPSTLTAQYQLCDLNTTPDCSTGNITVSITPVFAEVQATPTSMGDVEFDWGRDGVYCASCNFGDGNARANWTDRSGNIWIAHLNPNTGLFVSPGANDEQVTDARAFFWNAYGNGPEWAFSTQNGQVVSQLVYSRYANGDPNPPTQQAPGYSGAAFATQTAANTWTASFFPEAINDGNGTIGTDSSNLPEASQCNTDPLSTAMYKNFANPMQLYTEPVSSAPGTSQLLAPAALANSNGIGERFVPCTHQVLYQGNDALGAQQVFWYDFDTGVVSQLTFDETTHSGGFMFQAPDFGDAYILVTISAHAVMQVYQQTGTNGDGSPAFALVNSISSADSSEPYLNTMEPFILCTPQCTTYAFTTVAKNNSQNGITEPNGLAVMALSPNTPLNHILVQSYQTPLRQRLDPEYFITPNGAYLYYNQITPESASTKYQNNGEYFIDMQLGIPSGPCNGSSAEDGMVQGCGQ